MDDFSDTDFLNLLSMDSSTKSSSFGSEPSSMPVNYDRAESADVYANLCVVA